MHKHFTAEHDTSSVEMVYSTIPNQQVELKYTHCTCAVYMYRVEKDGLREGGGGEVKRWRGGGEGEGEGEREERGEEGRGGGRKKIDP